MAQASYDLARLRHNGLITRCPHSNTYHLTGDGLRFAIFYTKVCNRVLAPLFTADQPQAPPELRNACTPSTTTWPTSPPAPGCLRQPENSAQLSKSSTQRVARPKGSLVGHSLGGGVPVGVVEGGERLVSSDGQLERSA
jgi:hypothetical protein